MSGSEHNLPMYCPECDEIVPENFDRFEDDWVCPKCDQVGLYEDKEEYINVIHWVAVTERESPFGPGSNSISTTDTNQEDSQ